MLAVSGMLYRLYANVPRDLVTSWCEAKKKIPDTQFGFYPRRNTLQPMFILRPLLLRRLNAPAIHPDFMPLLLIPNKLMTLSHGKPFGTTCTAFACLPPCSTL